MRSKKLRNWKLIGVILSLLLIGGCKNEGRDSKRKSSEDMIQGKEELKLKLNKAIDEADARINELQEQSSGTVSDADNSVKTAISRIQEERQKIVNQAEKVANASDDTWDEVKTESLAAMDHMQNAFDSVKQTVKELVK